MKYYIAEDMLDDTPVVFTEKEVYDYEKEHSLEDMTFYFDKFCEQELSRYDIFTYDYNKLKERYVTWYINYMINNEWVEVDLSNITIQSIKNGD